MAANLTRTASRVGVERPRAGDRLEGGARFTGPPIFVTGCNRGGTTILTQLLSFHPEVRNIGRGHVLEGQYVWRERFPDVSRHRWALPPWCWYLRRTAQDATPEQIAFFHRAFQGAMPCDGRMLEKTPANAVRIPFIDVLYPDCHFVHVVRDGRATSASLMARKVWWFLAPHQWVAAHRIALTDLKRLPPNRVTVVRYEELTAAPERVLGELCLRAGLDWAAEEREAVIPAAGSALRQVECRWERLPRYQKRYILSVIGELQKELGYPVEE